MSQHRIIHADGTDQCYACGCVSDERGALSAVPCHPGGWEHPPYVVGLLPDGPSAGEPYVETCAAHPYSGCGNLAYQVTRGHGTPYVPSA